MIMIFIEKRMEAKMIFKMILAQRSTLTAEVNVMLLKSCRDAECKRYLEKELKDENSTLSPLP